MKTRSESLANRLNRAKSLAVCLDSIIVLHKSRDYFMRLPMFWLGDADRFLSRGELNLASFALSSALRKLREAQRVIATYGPVL